MITNHQRHRRTDRRHAIARPRFALCIVHRAVKTNENAANAVLLRALAYIRLQGGPKNWEPFFLYALTLPNINRLSKFHSQNQKKICNNAVAKDPTTPQVCRYTTL